MDSSPPLPLTPAQIQARKDEIFDFFAAAQRRLPPASGLASYTPRSTDVIVTTFPKAGTTLMQQLLYQICLFGRRIPHADDHNFIDISEKVPWLDYIHLHDDSHSDQTSSPRLYKTHSPASRFKRYAQRHVVVLRDPKTFPSSFLDFSLGCMPAVGKRVAQYVQVRQALLDEVYERHVLGTVSAKGCDAGTFDTDGDDCDDDDDDCDAAGRRFGPWFRWVRGWIDRATTTTTTTALQNNKSNNNNVLLLFYEDIVQNTPSCVETVAAFLNIQLTHGAVHEVARRCSRDHMAGSKQFQSRWGARALGIGGSSPRVRAAQNARGGFKSLQLSKTYDGETRRQMKRAFGYETYEEFKLGYHKLGVGVASKTKCETTDT